MSRPYLPPSHHFARVLLGGIVLTTLALLIWLAADHHAGSVTLTAGVRFVTWARDLLSNGSTES